MTWCLGWSLLIIGFLLGWCTRVSMERAQTGLTLPAKRDGDPDYARACDCGISARADGD